MPPQPDRRVVLVLSGLLLALGLLLYKLGGYLTDSPTRLLDLNWLALTDGGFVPYRDFWVERPPLLAGWSWLAYRASLLLPPWIDWRLFFALFDGIAGLAGGLAALAIASRLLSALRLATFGASLALVAFTLAGDGTILLALTLGWLALLKARRDGAATALAGLSSLVAGPVLLLVHLGWELVGHRRGRAALALAPLAAVVGGSLLAGGQLGASARALLATGGAPLFTATERRLDPTLAPMPGLEWLLPLLLVSVAAIVAVRTRRTLVEGAALLFAAAGLVGPLGSPDTLLILGALPLLAWRLVPATLLSASLGLGAVIWLAAAPGEQALAIGGAVGGFLVAGLLARWRPASATDESGAEVGQMVAFVALRLGALLLLRPFGYFGEWNDFKFFLGWARLADEGLLPFRDFWMEHPPLFPSLVVVAYQLSRLLPPLPDEHVWFNLTLGLLTFPLEVAALLATRRVAALVGPPGAVGTASWAYVLSFPALFFWTAGFDGMVVAFTLLGVAAALAGRPGHAGCWIGLGTVTKIVPATVLPALLLAAGWRNAARLILAFATVVAVVLLPVVVANPRLAAASAASLTTRGSWETVWALADGYYRGGELVPPRDRVDPASVQGTARPSAVPWLPVAAAGALGYLVLLLRARRPCEPRRTLALAAAGLIGLLTISKGWSPQFIVYPLGLIFLVLPARRALLYAVNLVAATAFEYPVALLLLDGELVPLAIAVLWRTLTLAALTIELLGVGLDTRLGRVGAPVAAALRVAPLGFLPLALGALLAYRALWLEPDDPARAVLAAATHSRGILATSDAEVRRLAPYASVPLLRPVAGQIAAAALAARPVWLLPVTDPAAAALEAELAPYGVVVSRLERPAAALFRPIAAPWQPREEVLGGQRLAGYSVVALDEEPGSFGAGYVVSTRWEVDGAAPRDLRLFAHLLDGEGRLIAQSDGSLRPPVDRRIVPAAPGGSRLVVGLYDGATGRRLSGPDGQDAVELPLP